MRHGSRGARSRRCWKTRRWSAARVLVVDDNRDAADSLASMLEFLVASVQVARPGAARYRHAGHGRLRGRPAHPAIAGRRVGQAHRPHRLGAVGRPPPKPADGLRPTPCQAGGNAAAAGSADGGDRSKSKRTAARWPPGSCLQLGTDRRPTEAGERPLGDLNLGDACRKTGREVDWSGRLPDLLFLLLCPLLSLPANASILVSAHASGSFETYP